MDSAAELQGPPPRPFPKPPPSPPGPPGPPSPEPPAPWPASRKTGEAFGWLEEAVRQRDGFVIYAKVHPWLDSLRDDQRYFEILKKMNLAD